MRPDQTATSLLAFVSTHSCNAAHRNGGVNQDGSFGGYIGSCVDITEQKQAQQALSAVSRRLIEAQEQERARIARELHDDISQRLGLLAIELDQLQQNASGWPAEARSRIGELLKQTSEIATDLQS